MKIEISDEFRQRLANGLVRMDEALRADAAARSELADLVAKYEADKRSLTAEISGLKRQILQNPDAAGKIPALSLRLEAIDEAGKETRDKIEQLPDVELYHQTAILRDVVSHWSARITSIYADLLSSIFARRESAIYLLSSSDAMQSLRALSHSANNIVKATPAHVDYVRLIFNRALRGQPNLLSEISETESAR